MINDLVKLIIPIYNLCKKIVGLGSMLHLIPKIILVKNEKWVALEFQNITFSPTMIRHIVMCTDNETRSMTSIPNVNIGLKPATTAIKQICPLQGFEKRYQSEERYKFLLILDDENMFYYYDFAKIHFILGISKSYSNKKTFLNRVFNYMRVRKLRAEFFETIKVYDINT